MSATAIDVGTRQTFLSHAESDGPPFTIHGIALGSGDVTKGSSGVKKLWPGDELREAAETLQGTNLVVNHENNAQGVVGRVTKAGFEEGVGILYEAELFDEELAHKISNGLLEVSVRGHHADIDEMEEDEETNAKVVEDITFDNLSIVASGASPSNTVEMGPAAELSEAELSEHVADLQEEEEEIGPATWVKWDGGRGVTTSQVENGEVEVDVYEEIDGKWRFSGTTKTLDVDTLEIWDVDVNEEIGAPKDENDEEENAENDTMSTEQLQEIAIHEPSFDSTADKEWNEPTLNEFTDQSWEDLSESEKLEIADNYLISKDGQFPPEDFTSLALPVVEPDGTLNLNALTAAKARAGQVGGVSDEEEQRLNEIINTLANENFPDATFGDEEEAGKHFHQATLEMIPEFLDVEGNSEDTFVSAFVEWADDDLVRQAVDEFVKVEGNSMESGVGALQDWLEGKVEEEAHRVQGEEEVAKTKQNQPWRYPEEDGDIEPEECSDDADDGTPETAFPVAVHTGDDLRAALSDGASEMGGSNNKVINMTNLEDKLEELDEPVAVEKDNFESLQDKADRFDEMSENLEALRERTDVLDEVDREKVDELAETEDAVVLSGDEYEALTAEAEQVKEVYAETLSEEGPFSADELTDKFSIEELREKYEETGHDLDEELEADPRSGDVDEEELEEKAEEDDKSEEELAEEEEIAEKQAELREKILGN